MISWHRSCSTRHSRSVTSGYSKSLNEGRNLSSPALKELIEIELISWSDNRFQNFGIRLIKKLKRSLQFFTISLVKSPLLIPRSPLLILRWNIIILRLVATHNLVCFFSIRGSVSCLKTIFVWKPENSNNFKIIKKLLLRS